MDKLMNLIGIEEVEDEPEVEPVVQRASVAAEPRGRKTSLVSLPGGGRPVRVVVADPTSFDEVQSIADQLKGRRPVIVNLESMDKEPAQRLLHFLSGTIYALDGQMQRISTSIFLFAPPNVEVALREPREESAKERTVNLFGK
jgi:cell division inhibitor SepF